MTTVRSTVFIAAAIVVLEVGFKVLLAALVAPEQLQADDRYGLLAPTLVLPFGAALLGLLTAGGEWRYRLAVTTFLAEPRREVVLIAKMLVASVAAAIVGALSAVLGNVGIALVFAQRFSGAPSSAEIARASAGLVLACALLGALGAALGTLVTNQSLAITLAAAVLLILTPLLLALGPEVGAWLPGGAVNALSAQARVSDAVLPQWGGGLLLGAYLLLGAAAAWRTLLRRDL